MTIGASQTPSPYFQIDGTASAVNDTPIPSTEVTGLWVALQITGTFSGTLRFQGSNDDATWVTIPLQELAEKPSTSGTSLTPKSFHGPCPLRFFRVLASAWTSGTATVRAIFYPNTGSAIQTSIIGGTIAHDDIDAESPVKIGGFGSRTAPTAVADGDRVNAWFDEVGRLNVASPDPTKTLVEVRGAVADGGAILSAANPVQIAGQDGTNVQSLLTDTGGRPETVPRAVVSAMVDGSTNSPRLMTDRDGNVVNQITRLQVFNGATWDRQPGNTTGTFAVGNVAHDAVDSGNPVKVGLKAVDHGTNPTAVAAADRTDWFANRAGIPFVIGGHPNVITTEYRWVAATAASDDIIVAAPGTKIVVTRITVTVDEATTVGVKVRVGFGDTLPVEPADGAAVVGVLLSHGGIVPGGGLTIGDGSGILGIGADGEDLSITATAATSGEAHVTVSHYTIPS